MKRIVVLVSGGGTNLQVLIDAEKAGRCPDGKIVAVIGSNPDAYALERARQSGIKAYCVTRRDYPGVKEYSEALLAALLGESPDLVVYAGFMTIVDECVVRAFPQRMLNVHPALIPSFSGKGFYGLRVHEAALARGVRLTGATVHFVDEVCDGGPIVLQKAVEVRPGDTPEILQKRVMTEAEQVILPEAVRLFCAGKITVQDGKVQILQ